MAAEATTPEELRREVERIDWFHHIDLGHGIVTRGKYDNRRTLERLRLPERLDGLSVLDVGAWDGFYSFECERRGAARVLATDSWSWGGPGWGTKEGFELARRVLGSSVEDEEVDVLDLSAERVGRFDLVLYLGVLYHMRHPLLALERVFEVTGDMLVLETHIERLPLRRPAMVFYPGSELNDDSANWWGPNRAAVEAMLRAVGFRRVELVGETALAYTAGRFAYKTAKGVWGRLRQGRPITPTATQARVVFHAWR